METTGGMFAILLIGIILGGIGSLVCLIFTIIMLANGKRNPSIIWGVSFLISVCVLVLSIVQMVQGVIEKTKDGINSMSEWGEDHKDDAYNNYGDDAYNDEAAKKNWLDTLDYYVRESVRPRVPVDFYANKKVEVQSDGSVIAPFIYPYFVKFSADNYGVADIINDNNDSVFVRNVLAFSFDENFVIAKIDNKGSKDLLEKGTAEIEYVLFDMRTGVYESFNNEAKLNDFANRIGFVGNLDMKYLSTEYYAWTKEMDSEEYD